MNFGTNLRSRYQVLIDVARISQARAIALLMAESKRCQATVNVMEMP